MVSMEGEKGVAKLQVGHGLYVANCASCHGADRKGNGHEIPSLLGVGQRLKPWSSSQILKNTAGRMPSFNNCRTTTPAAVISFLVNSHPPRVPRRSRHHMTPQGHAHQQKAPFPYVLTIPSPRMGPNSSTRGLPQDKAPEPCNAIDLNTGDYRSASRWGNSPSSRNAVSSPRYGVLWRSVGHGRRPHLYRRHGRRRFPRL